MKKASCLASMMVCIKGTTIKIRRVDILEKVDLPVMLFVVGVLKIMFSAFVGLSTWVITCVSGAVYFKV